MTDAAAIQKAIDHCAQRRDGRGRWRAQRTLAWQLRGPGHSPVVADACAAAAVRIGAWLATK